MKFALFFLAVALVASAQGSPTEQRALQVPEAVEYAVRDYREVIDAAKKKAVEIRERVKELAREILQKSSEKVKEILGKIEARFNDVYRKFGKIDLSHCQPILPTMKSIIEQSVQNMGGCVSETVDIGKEYISAIFDAVKDAPLNMDSVTQGIRACVESKDDLPWSGKAAIGCFRDLTSELYASAADTFATITQNVIKMAHLAGSTTSEKLTVMPKCMATKGYDSFLARSEDLWFDMSNCFTSNFDAIKQD